VSIPYVYDAGVLIAIDNNDRRVWAIHHLAIEEGRRLLVPAPVVGQAWRDSRRQPQLGRFLSSCEVVTVGLDMAKMAGVFCGRAGTGDVVDALVLALALAHGAIVFTSDPDDIAHLSNSVQVRPGVVVRRV
jgi:hypothetical protein